MAEPLSRRRLVTARNNVRCWSHGEPTVVLSHGFGCDQQVWRRVVPLLAPHVGVLAFDHLGSGRSDPTLSDGRPHDSLEAYVDDLREILDVFDLRRAILVGHSVGGMISLQLAATAPARVAGLVLVASTPRMLNDAGYHGGFEPGEISALIALMKGPASEWSGYLSEFAIGADRPDLRAEFATALCFTPPAAAHRFADVAFHADVRPHLPHCAVETLILQCAADPMVPLAAAECLRRQIPHAEMQMLDVQGHCPHMSAPERVAAAILGFVTRVSDRAASD